MIGAFVQCNECDHKEVKPIEGGGLPKFEDEWISLTTPKSIHQFCGEPCLRKFIAKGVVDAGMTVVKGGKK